MFGFSRLSLLWKTLLSTSIAITLLFAATVLIVQHHVVQSTSESLEDEVRASFRAYESLWRAHADKLASISLILSTMSDVRAAFTTGDEATIRDTAAELWNRVSEENALFLVTDPTGGAAQGRHRRQRFYVSRRLSSGGFHAGWRSIERNFDRGKSLFGPPGANHGGRDRIHGVDYATDGRARASHRKAGHFPFIRHRRPAA